MYFTGRALDATRTQIAVAEQGQLTDRFTKAVDQLDRTGPDRLQARLGAIYALERLARDSARDQPTIIEILSAFVRTTTPRLTPAPARTTTCPSQSVAPDIHAALTVLGRRNATHDQNSRIDLINTCLTGANLSGANLSRANLVGADFNGADLGSANLGSADLVGAHLSGTDLIGTDLNGAILNGAILVGANLSRADLSGAILNGTDLVGANLSDANLSDANLNDADLSSADLRSANLKSARHNEKTNIADVKTDEDTDGAWW